MSIDNVNKPEMKEIPVQICFSKDADLHNVENQLRNLMKDKSYRFYSCFLPKHIVEEKGWATDIIDMIDEVLGERHIYMGKNYQNFEQFMLGLNDLRRETAEKVSKMFILDSGTAEGVQEEIKLFTNMKVILLP